MWEKRKNCSLSVSNKVKENIFKLSFKQQFTLTHSFSFVVAWWPWATITTHVIQVRTSYKKLHWLRVHSQPTCSCLLKQEFQQTTSAVTILNTVIPLTKPKPALFALKVQSIYRCHTCRWQQNKMINNWFPRGMLHN